MPRSKQKRNAHKALAIATAILCGGSSWAFAGPFWWKVRGATGNASTNDQAVAVSGQAKHFASKAIEELGAQLKELGGAGEALDAMTQQEWMRDVVKDHAVLQIGQLKFLARPFYDRLYELNVSPGHLPPGEIYPWSGDTADDNDLAPATIGQLKHVFGFDLDRDGDGVPDWWEQRELGGLDQNGGSDIDEDGLTLDAEREAGSNPMSADTDGDGRRDGDDADPLVFGDQLVAQTDVRLELFVPQIETKAEADALREWVNEKRTEEGLPALPDPSEVKRLRKEKEAKEKQNEENQEGIEAP